MYTNTYMQVIYSTKYIVRKESTRDHVDLLLSMKHWPLVYAVDMACDVVAHTEVRLPALANALWGERRGCFEKPSTTSQPNVGASITIVHACIANHVSVTSEH